MNGDALILGLATDEARTAADLMGGLAHEADPFECVAIRPREQDEGEQS